MPGTNPARLALSANTAANADIAGGWTFVRVTNKSTTDSVWVSGNLLSDPVPNTSGTIEVLPGNSLVVTPPYIDGTHVQLRAISTGAAVVLFSGAHNSDDLAEPELVQVGATGGSTVTQVKDKQATVSAGTSGVTPTATGTITASGNSVAFAIPDTARTVAFMWAGASAFSGLNITYEVSFNGGTDWQGLAAVSLSGGTFYSSGVTGVFSSAGTTGPAHLAAVPPGATDIRARSTALTSGTAALYATTGTQPVQPTVSLANFAASSAGADGFSNPTTAPVNSVGYTYNGTTWDRLRGTNTPAAVDTSSARTSSGTGTTFTNYNGRFVSFFINVTAVSGTTPTATFRVQETYDGTNWIDIDTTNLQTASITATGQYKLRLGPGLPVTANASANVPAQRLLRLAWTIGGTTPSFTFATYAVSHM